MCAQPYDMPLEQLQTYCPPLTRKADFELFWDNALMELNQVPMDICFDPQPYPANVSVSRVTFTGAFGHPVAGVFVRPDTRETLPGIVMFNGYNWAFDGNIHSTVDRALHGYAVLHMYARGQQGHVGDALAETHGHHSGWMSKNILNKEQYYYKAVYLDAVRAVEHMAGISGVDPDRIAVEGGSQGGGIALASAALSPIPVLAVAEAPFLCHIDRAVNLAQGGPYLELNEYFRRNPHPETEKNAWETLSYVDIMNLAPRIRCYTRVTCGLTDTVTPPSTIYAAYNHLQCEKEMHPSRYFGHEFTPANVIPKLSLMRKYLL